MLSLPRSARARTFGFLADYERLRAMNLAQGGSLDNAVVVDDYQILNSDGLRLEDEFAKHKILDAMGDLYLLGHALIGRFVGFKSGHGTNNALVRRILEQPDKVQGSDLRPRGAGAQRLPVGIGRGGRPSRRRGRVHPSGLWPRSHPANGRSAYPGAGSRHVHAHLSHGGEVSQRLELREQLLNHEAQARSASRVITDDDQVLAAQVGDLAVPSQRRRQQRLQLCRPGRPVRRLREQILQWRKTSVAFPSRVRLSFATSRVRLLSAQSSAGPRSAGLAEQGGVGDGR